jgi:hypothetical protein
VVGAFSIPGAVVAGLNEGPVLHLLREERSKLHSPLDTVRYSLSEFSIMAYLGVDAPLRVEPMMVVPLSPLLGERLRQPK